MRLLRHVSLGFLAAFVLLSHALSAGAQTTFSTVVAFGDSLSDTGNIAHLVQTASGGAVRYPAYNPLFSIDYTDGRFTDGKDTQPAAQAYFGVWIEQLAAFFPAKPAVVDSLDGGTNYAYGDATTATSSTTLTEGPISITLHNMGQQVADYLGSSAAPKPNAQTLYSLWGGANDVYKAVDTAAQNGTDLNAAATSAATAAVSNELALMQQLISAGATNFIVPNLPPLGGVPNYATSAASVALNNGAAAFAQALAQGLTTLKANTAAQGITLHVYQPDVLTLFTNLATNPMSVGLGSVTGVAQKLTSGSPDPYLIWDGVHPTTTGHHFAAATAANLFTPLVGSTTALTSPSIVIAGQPATVSVKVGASGSSTGATPTGLVTFFSGTDFIGSTPLVSGAGTATIPASALAAGAYNLTAVYAGDTTYSVSASAVQPLTVLPALVGTTTTLTTSNANAGIGTQITFTATVTPASTSYGTPTGTVTFLDGTTSLGTGTLTNGVATFSTSNLGAGGFTLGTGTYTITASYAATGVFAGSVSDPVTETLVTPGFTVQRSPSSLTITAGGSGTTQITATAFGGYTGTLNLTCGTLPAHLSCTFSPTSLVLTGTTTVSSTLTVATNASAALALPPRPGSWSAPATFAATLLWPGCAGLVWFGWRKRQTAGRLRGLQLAVIVGLLSLGAMLGLSGCGGSTNNYVAKGSYNVSIIVTSAGATSGLPLTVNLPVIVQ